MDSFEESDEDFETISIEPRFCFWNNWIPRHTGKKQRETENLDFSVVKPVVTDRFTNRPIWQRPDNFGISSIPNPQPEDVEKKFNETGFNRNTSSTFGWNDDWGERCPTLSSVEDGCVWDLIHPGLFGIFKLSTNSQGKLVAYGEAEYCSFDNAENVVIVVNEETILRKLLGVASDEWIALTEAIKVSHENFYFNAMSPVNWLKLNPLQQMWYVLCKRRHWLPSVSLKLQRVGSMRMREHLQILPKFLVTDIRSCGGIPLT